MSPILFECSPIILIMSPDFKLLVNCKLDLIQLFNSVFRILIIRLPENFAVIYLAQRAKIVFRIKIQKLTLLNLVCLV